MQRFGVELEMSFPCGDLSASFKRMIKHHKGYLTCEDATIGTPFGVEVVSPILRGRGRQGLAGLCDVATQAAALGAALTPTCGMHVHVDAGDMNVSQILRVALVAALHEDEIMRRVGVTETRYPWCAPMTDAFAWRARQVGDALWLGEIDEAEAMMRLSRSILSAPALRSDPKAFAAARGKRHRARYRGVNLYSWLYRGTTEFRWFQGTLDAAEIRRNVSICQNIHAFGRQAWDAPMPTEAQIFEVIQ